MCGLVVEEMTSNVEKQLAAIDEATLARLKDLVRGGVAQCGSSDIAPFSGQTADLHVCSLFFSLSGASHAPRRM